MLRSMSCVAALITAAVLSGNAQAPDPTYDAKFTLSGERVYTGTTTFAVDAKGVVTGKMQLTQPISVLGTLAGSIKAGMWTFEYTYEIPEQNCTGTVKGTAKMPTDRKVITGDVMIGGACVQQIEPATFTFTRQEKKTESTTPATARAGRAR